MGQPFGDTRYLFGRTTNEFGSRVLACFASLSFGSDRENERFLVTLVTPVGLGDFHRVRAWYWLILFVDLLFSSEC